VVESTAEFSQSDTGYAVLGKVICKTVGLYCWS
jgi:hypothetical protein